MAQRGALPPLRVQVPALGTAPSQRLSKYYMAFSPSTTPTPVIHNRPHTGRLWIAVLLQLSSLYAVHQWLSRSQEQSVVNFAFLSFFVASLVLGLLQRPWKGRAIGSSQWLLLLLSGGLLALSFMLRMRGLAVVGPLETILADYAGAVVGKVLIKAQRKVHGIGNAKVRGAVALFAGLYFLSQGWAVSSCSPLSSLFVPVTKTRTFVTARLIRSAKIGSSGDSRTAGGEEALQLEKDCAKYLSIIAPLCAGLLSSVQRLLPSRTSLGSIPKRRLQSLTYVTAGMVLLPVALFQAAVAEAGSMDGKVLWPLFSMIAFGMVGAYFAEFFSEEKLLISPLGTMHFGITACCVCILELWHGSNFSLIGFVVCCALLAIGVRAAAFISGGLDWNSMSEREYSGASVMSMIQTPLYHIWTDVKTRKIAMFLLINTSFMVVEFVFGFLSNSLGLISDACHMLFDCAALAIGLYASYISRLPANSKFQFGYGRFEVLSGYANAVFLILVASLIVLESLERLLEPPEISTGSLLIVSVGGLLVNVVGLIFFHEAHHHAHGSGPCVHVHAHHDTFVPIPAPKNDRDANVHHTSLKTSAPPKVVHSYWQSPSQSHHHTLDSPILNLQGTSQSRVENHSSNRSSPLTSSHSEPNETRASAHSQFSPHSHDGTSAVHEQAGGSLYSRNHEKHQVHSSGNHTADGQEGSKDKLAHQQQSARQEHNHLGAPQRSGSTHAHVHSESCSHGHHHNVASTAVQGHVGHEQAVTYPKPHEDQRGFLKENPRSGTATSEPKSPRHIHHKVHVLAKRPVLMRSASAFKNQMVVIHPHHPHTNSSSGDTHGHGHLGEHQEHNHDHHGHGVHTHSAFKHQQVVMECDDHHDQSASQPNSSQADVHGHGHGHFNNHHVQGHSGDYHGHNHSGIDNDGEDKIHLRQLVHISGELDGDFDSDHHHHHNHKANEGHSGEHSHHHGGKPCSHDHSHEHGGHEGHDHHHHGHSHGDHDDHGDHQHIDHNMEGIFLHILADTLGSVGVVISTLLIKYKGWLFTDPACSIFISVLIVSSVVPLVRNSAELLLQRVPRSAEKRIEKALKKVEVVDGVHDWHKLHVWSYTNTELVGTLRLHASLGTDKQLVRGKVTKILQAAGISDLTLEVEDLEHEDE
ncbi:solute carrier family 30 (zinc transporter), member 5/7 [Marchantia polymorpha subsp. ruderalis]|uniref:Cation efflux protein transmembrane domain-containing protein n=2 Tax=Marchantia polymorpha TaxID=3197 RepID=A0AAF6AZ07_MARPO|nr:hypothetical protein MARPO_0085s0089 [Marchantia polymorpha]BBN04991.1 hypothetical protein Mp_3g09380 [Marchantia polymorpha subsp. ruderalis]|eukprot:PTQ33885.1 hypothetical protein MARPO_0085s0089 [Marchantia polymorpha]